MKPLCLSLSLALCAAPTSAQQQPGVRDAWQQFLRDHGPGWAVEWNPATGTPCAVFGTGLDLPAARAFVAAVGGEVNPKFGWTDVARFSALGIPAVNFGPGDPSLAHRQDEHVPVAQIVHCEQALRAWLEVDA